MGLFDKKYCDICGEKIGLLGNRKLEDGNLCKDCAKKLSPWFDERRHSTVEQIRSQLEYREQNRVAVQQFQTSRTFGKNTLLHIDDANRKFMVCKTKNRDEENPDVLDLSQVTGCDLDIDESRTEEKRDVKDKDGNVRKESYNPPRYIYDYDFNVIIRVNHPYFDDIKFRLNNSDVRIRSTDANAYAGNRALRTGSNQSFGESIGAGIVAGLAGALNMQSNDGDFRMQNPEYAQFYQMGMEIKDALMGTGMQMQGNMTQMTAPDMGSQQYATGQIHQGMQSQPQMMPGAQMTCPYCNATTTPDVSGKCEYCGAQIG